MALFFYGGRRRYSSRYRSGRSYRRAYSSTSRSQRRASRNQKAAVQQRDQGEVVLNIPTKVDVFNGNTEIREADIDGVAEPYDIRNGVYALNIWELMRKSEFYQSYANMYDQVKLDKVTIKLTPYQFPIVNYGYQAGITNYYNSYTIVTAWDRTGLSPEQTRWVISRGTLDDKRKTVIGTEADGDGLYIDISGSQAATYSSAIQRNINPNSSTASITRSIYPTTIAEKAYWVNTSELKEWYNGYDGERGRFYGLIDPGGVATRDLVVPLNPAVNVPQYPFETTGSISNVNTRNPCYIQESSQVPFKPTLLIGLLNDPINVNVAGMAQQQQLTPRMKFNVECDCVVTFRGLRKASIVE